MLLGDGVDRIGSGPCGGHMATFVDVDRRVELGLSWRSIFVAVVVGLAVQFVFTLLGVAIGLTALDVTGADQNARGVGFGAGLWTLVVAVLAWFLGAYVGSWSSGAFNRATGIVHGVTAWGIGLFLILALVGSSITGAISTGFGLVSEGAKAAGSTGLVQRRDLERGSQALEESARQLEESVPGTAQKVATTAARGAWGAFFTAALSLGAAAVGGAAGARRLQRRSERIVGQREVTVTGPLTPRPT
jgi:hypothetical protein